MSTLKRNSKLLFRQWITAARSNENGFCQCVTCGAWYHHTDSRSHSGHFLHGRNSTYFVICNTHMQCETCNYYGQGSPRKYAQYIATTYGVDRLQWLFDLYENRIDFTREQLELMVTELRVNIRALGCKPHV